VKPKRAIRPRPNPAKTSLTGPANEPTAPSPWPGLGTRPYGGPAQPLQPNFDPSGKLPPQPATFPRAAKAK
jgi:hypothetical protein